MQVLDTAIRRGGRLWMDVVYGDRAVTGAVVNQTAAFDVDVQPVNTVEADGAPATPASRVLALSLWL